MKAAVRSRYGPPDVVRLAEFDDPVVGDHDVLIAVHVTTVNRTDCGFRSGHPWIVRFFSGLVRPKVQILGSEFAGVVEAVGRSVTRYQVGDRVFGFSEGRFGAHAERLTMQEDGALATVPEGMPFEEVAPSTEGSHYALSLITKARIGSNHRVLMNGATGAIGSAAVQLLKDLGAYVVAVCGAEHVELVRGLGADRVIDRDATDFTRDEETYDVVFDAVGKSSFGRCRHLLGPRGIYLSTDLGPLSSNPLLALVTPPFGRRKVMFPIPPRHTRREVERIAQMLASDRFRPVIDRRYPLEQIVEAYRYVETGQKIGNVPIEVREISSPA